MTCHAWAPSAWGDCQGTETGRCTDLRCGCLFGRTKPLLSRPAGMPVAAIWHPHPRPARASLSATDAPRCGARKPPLRDGIALGSAPAGRTRTLPRGCGGMAMGHERHARHAARGSWPAPTDDPHDSETCRPRPMPRRNQACLAGCIDLPACVAELDGSSSGPMPLTSAHPVFRSLLKSSAATG